MRDHRRLIAGLSLRLLVCLPLLATTACTADAIAGPQRGPEPEAAAQTAAAADAAQKAVATDRAPRGIRLCGGCGSVQTGESPLYVVDGVPWSGSLDSLRASDIVSITVVKGATLTGINGNRTITGLVIITTRGGASRRPAKPVAGGDARP